VETKVAEFKVRNVGLAARCEVCHQDDLFNPETGECARCCGVLTIDKAPSPTTFSTPVVETETKAHQFWYGRNLALGAAILSSFAAVPGTAMAMAILVLVLRALGTPKDTSDPFVFLGIAAGSLGFIGVGFCQLYWYWKTAIGTTRSNQRKKLWGGSAVYNGVLLLALGHELAGWDLFLDPMSIVWLGWLAVMTMISGLALLEEYKPR
jgi:hypothetical protein